MVTDFDFRGLADILGTHIGFLEAADCEANVFTRAGEFVGTRAYCIAVLECFAKAASSAKSMSRTSKV